MIWSVKLVALDPYVRIGDVCGIVILVSMIYRWCPMIVIGVDMFWFVFDMLRCDIVLWFICIVIVCPMGCLHMLCIPSIVILCVIACVQVLPTAFLILCQMMMFRCRIRILQFLVVCWVSYTLTALHTKSVYSIAI